jgi:hypothetical protein
MRKCFHQVVVVLCVLCVVGLARGDGAAKTSVPDAAAQAASLKTLKEIYGAQYGDTSAAGRKKLAQDLLAAARTTTDDSTGRFVLLREARDAAMQAGDASTALGAIDDLGGAYAVNAAGMRSAVVVALAGRAGAVEAGTVAAAGVSAMNDFIAMDDYAAAAKLSPAVTTALNKAQDDSIRAQLKAAQATIAEYERTKGAFQKLATSADDPAANLTVGKFYCFYKGDWSKGIPLLLKGGDAKLKALAEAEASVPEDGQKRKDLADAWWDWSEAQASGTKTKAREHAGEWYRKAAEQLKGLPKAAVDKRLEQLAAMDAGLADAPSTGHKSDVVAAAWSAPDNTQGVAWLKTTDSKYSEVRPGGKDAVVTSQILYFRVDHRFAFNLPQEIDERVFVRLHMFDEKPTQMAIIYDGYPSPTAPDPNSHWRKTPVLVFEGTGRWVQRVVELTEPRLANGLTNKADFRLEPNGNGIPAVGSLAVERVKIRPAAQRAVPSGTTVDLMPLIDPDVEVISGTWKKQGTAIAAGPDEAATLELPAVVHGDYQLDIRFVRLTGKDSINLLLPVGTGFCDLFVDGYGSTVSGMGRIDGKELNMNEATVHGHKLTNGVPATLSIRVTLDGGKATVRADLNGEHLIDWTGEQKRLDYWRKPGRSDTVGLLSYHNTMRFDSIRLTALGSGTVLLH